MYGYGVSRSLQLQCNTSENAVISSDFDRSFPIKPTAEMSESNGSRAGGPVDLDVVFEDMFCEHRDALKVSASEYATFHHGPEAQPPVVGDTGRYALKKTAVDGGANQKSFKKSSALSKFRLVKSKLFHEKHANPIEPNQMEDTVVFDDIMDSSPERHTHRPESTPCEKNDEVNDNISKSLFSNEDVVATKQNAMSEKDINPIFRTSLKKSRSEKKDEGPPVAEIIGHRRTNSDDTDMSSISGTKDNPLEFSLSNNGFREESPYMASLTEDIIQLIERRRTLSAPQPTDGGITQPVGTLPKCFILLTDPMKRIFEIVPALYRPHKTTVGELLTKVPIMATDHRLKRQTYIGLAYKGVHLSPEIVPIEAIQDSVKNRKPLMAIPANYSAEQMELVGNSLLSSPPVRKLLDDQLAALEATAARSERLGHVDSTMTAPPSQMTQVVFCSPPNESQQAEV